MSDPILDQIFEKEGLLDTTLSDYENRPEQQEMAKKIWKAYEEGGIALIEAGTGIGKSLAYLIPAVLFAKNDQEKTIISTYTIALQEQLLKKDIPFLLKALNVDIKAVLVKGMGNYLCLKKLDELSAEYLLLDEDEKREYEKIEKWAATTKEGDRSTHSFSSSPYFWDKVQADGDSCTMKKCPHYRNCFFFKARRNAETAQILVVNHHLLFSDLQKKIKGKSEDEKAILPKISSLILDEAHHLEEVALESLIERVEMLSLYQTLQKLIATGSHKGKLFQLKTFILKQCPSEVVFLEKLDIELPAQRQTLGEWVEEAFSSLPLEEGKWPLKACPLSQVLWKEKVIPLFKRLEKELFKFSQSLEHLIQDLKTLWKNSHLDSAWSLLQDIEAIASFLMSAALFLEHFFISSKDPIIVRWIEVEKNRKNIALLEGRLDISTSLKKHLFEQLKTATLCSATLATGGNFQFIKQRLGIEEVVSEGIYASPFDFQNQALLLVADDLPDPQSPQFVEMASKRIFQAIHVSHGGVFVLFTSYQMMKSSYEMVRNMKNDDREWFLQNDLPRQILLEKFKKSKKGVLFGTDSFWEGVDVPGEALQLVIITKLPFKVPTEPLFQAQGEMLQANKKDPFFDLAVPQAVIKFKQGFGRLIRKKTDRGCIFCLDHRLMTKSYGKVFLSSLPPCQTVFGKSDVVLEAMKKFFKST